MDSPNFLPNIAFAVETEYRRADSRSEASSGGSVYANPPAWAGFSLQKLWNKLGSNAQAASQPVNEDTKLREASLQA